VGTLNYGPNEHGVKWLVQAILPAIRARVGATDVTLTVIGRAPPDWMREQAAAGAFALHADVPDVKPFYDACDAVVVPISAGGGTRIKILEAFGYGRVVVSTTLGAEGIEAEPGKDFLIADSQSEFAEAVVRLIETPPLGVTLVGNARKTVEQHYSMSACEHAVTMNFMLAGNGETRGVAMAHA
jgi:glycosyltransferase involved in cell wall biosynthesis